MGDADKRAGIGVLVVLAGVIGFGIGRNYPVETRLEKECREWATKVATEKPYIGDPDPSIIPVLIGRCLNGR